MKSDDHSVFMYCGEWFDSWGDEVTWFTKEEAECYIEKHGFAQSPVRPVVISEKEYQIIQILNS